MKRRIRIWLVYCSQTGGHRICAISFANFLENAYPSFDVRVFNILHSFPLVVLSLEKILRGGNHVLPKVWKSSYMALSRPQGSYSRWTNKLIKSILGNRIIITKIIDEYRAFDPDVVVSFHDVSNSVFAHLKHRGIVTSRVVSAVVPDLNTHRLWVHDEIEKYYVASETVRDQVIAYGIPGERVLVTGVPLRESFGHVPSSRERKRLRHQLSLSTSAPIVTIMGGYFGEIGYVKILDSIARFVTVPSEYCVIFGKNQGAMKRAKSVKPKSGVRFNWYGLVDDPSAMLNVSDLLVSKCGGLTAAEALGVGVPMLVVEPKSGQEVLNSHYIAQMGAGSLIRNASQIGQHIETLLKDRVRLDRMADRARHGGAMNRKAKVLIGADISKTLCA